METDNIFAKMLRLGCADPSTLKISLRPVPSRRACLLLHRFKEIVGENTFANKELELAAAAVLLAHKHSGHSLHLRQFIPTFFGLSGPLHRESYAALSADVQGFELLLEQMAVRRSDPRLPEHCIRCVGRQFFGKIKEEEVGLRESVTGASLSLLKRLYTTPCVLLVAAAAVACFVVAVELHGDAGAVSVEEMMAAALFAVPGHLSPGNSSDVAQIIPLARILGQRGIREK